MKYVLDASVALKWVLIETDTPKARTLREEYRQQLHEFLAPDTFTAEVAHALTRAERRNIISPPQSLTLLADVMLSLPVLHPHLPLLPRAVLISSEERVGAYDCLYVALAEREGCQLLTADNRLVTNLGAQFPFIVDLASLP